MDTKSFSGVDQEVWDSLRAHTTSEHGTVYKFDDANSGTATTSVPAIGDIVLGFKFDPAQATLTYTIVKKPFIVGVDRIWSGIQEGIDKSA